MGTSNMGSSASMSGMEPVVEAAQEGTGPERGHGILPDLRVLIICTHFPPSNATGARRPYYLARTLLDQGIGVTVLTSTMELPDPWMAEMEGIEVLRLPTTPIPDDLTKTQRRLAYLYWRLKDHVAHVIPRTLAFLFLPLDIESRMDFDERRVSEQIMRCDIVVSTGPGWSTFEFGHRISQHWGCPFLVDYRDPWNVVIPEVGLRTVTWYGSGLIGWLKRLRMRRVERKYTAQVAGVTGATRTVMLNALRCVGEHPSMVVHNGFDFHEVQCSVEPYSKLTMLYTGRLYHEQEWNIVVEALETIHSERPELAKEIELLLVGPISEDHSLLNVLHQCAERTGMVRMMGRVGRDEALDLQRSVDLLLHVGFKDKRGILPVKFIEYLNAGRPILQVSTGYDEQEKILGMTRTGTVHPTGDSLRDRLIECWALRSAGKAIPHHPDEQVLADYTWASQMGRWSQFIQQVYLKSEKCSP